MKVIITGANGQLGTSLQEHVPGDVEVVALGSDEFDITSDRKIEEIFKTHKPDVVINTAAYTSVDKAEVEEERAREVNALAVKKLAAACRDNNVFLVHISTDYVFDGLASLPYKEADPINPINIYGKTKAEGEQAIIRSGAKYAIIRTSWVFSEFGTNFLKTMMRFGETKDRLNIVSDQMGAPTYAGDIADVIYTILQKQDTIDHEIFHFTGDQITSWADYAKFIFKTAFEADKIPRRVFVKGISADEYPTAAKRPKNSVMDCKKIKDLCDINASDWQSAVKKIITEKY